ncbi:MAG: enoyl-CoA hydratase/isomerase family protein [Caulobacteraceae bacterium]|nr:enoyl-CoA hydratase/isomerase family protein [Caulobacteraceae bacterium]
MTEEVLTRIEGSAGRISLNRPKALGALTTAMVEAMTDALLSWRSDSQVEAVLIDHIGERGFCAGGDIRFLAESARGDGAAARDFFFKEYQLNHLLMVYEKPVIAVMDGVTMGGGVGISLPARYRIATERTRFAMPETGIGLFPDVGAGWHLSRLPDQIGLWLALTGARLEAADCLSLGLATHVVHSARVPALTDLVVTGPQSIDSGLQAFAANMGAAMIDALRPTIARLFGGPTVEAIFAALEADGSAFAHEQLAILRTKSPLTMKVALRELADGAQMSNFAEEMVSEMRIGARMVMSHDFAEGVRAVIVDKDNSPKWDPATPEGVTHEMLDAIFAPLPAGEEWSPLPEFCQVD